LVLGGKSLEDKNARFQAFIANSGLQRLGERTTTVAEEHSVSAPRKSEWPASGCFDVGHFDDKE
jgi:hypothetical protein